MSAGEGKGEKTKRRQQQQQQQRPALDVYDHCAPESCRRREGVEEEEEEHPTEAVSLSCSRYV